MKNTYAWNSDMVMCCRMQFSRTCNMAGAFDDSLMRLNTDRC